MNSYPFLVRMVFERGDWMNLHLQWSFIHNTEIKDTAVIISIISKMHWVLVSPKICSKFTFGH